jgi:hypothetical protein
MLHVMIDSVSSSDYIALRKTTKNQSDSRLIESSVRWEGLILFNREIPHIYNILGDKHQRKRLLRRHSE